MKQSKWLSSEDTAEAFGGYAFVFSFVVGIIVLAPAFYGVVKQPFDGRNITSVIMLAVSVVYHVVLGILAFRYGKRTWHLMLLNMGVFILFVYGMMALILRHYPD